MKKLLFCGFYIYLSLSIAQTALLAVVIGVADFTYYLTLATNILLTVACGFGIREVKKQDKIFYSKVKEIDLIFKLREQEILKFYARHGIQPLFHKDGSVISPDELLGIVTKMDQNGELVKSIYEKLGIEPRFDKNGKEIPTFLVIKNIAKEFKMKDIAKYKGVVLKPKTSMKSLQDKIEVKKKVEAKKAAAKSSFKATSKGGPKWKYDSLYNKPKGGDKGGGSKAKSASGIKFKDTVVNKSQAKAPEQTQTAHQSAQPAEDRQRPEQNPTAHFDPSARAPKEPNYKQTNAAPAEKQQQDEGLNAILE